MMLQGGFSYSGQRCTAVKVVLVMEEVADELVKKVNKGVEELTVGMPEVSTYLMCWLESCVCMTQMHESCGSYIHSLGLRLLSRTRHLSKQGLQCAELCRSVCCPTSSSLHFCTSVS